MKQTLKPLFGYLLGILLLAVAETLIRKYVQTHHPKPPPIAELDEFVKYWTQSHPELDPFGSWGLPHYSCYSLSNSPSVTWWAGTYGDTIYFDTNDTLHRGGWEFEKRNWRGVLRVSLSSTNAIDQLNYDDNLTLAVDRGHWLISTNTDGALQVYITPLWQTNHLAAGPPAEKTNFVVQSNTWVPNGTNQTKLLWEYVQDAQGGYGVRLDNETNWDSEDKPLWVDHPDIGILSDESDIPRSIHYTNPPEFYDNVEIKPLRIETNVSPERLKELAQWFTNYWAHRLQETNQYRYPPHPLGELSHPEKRYHYDEFYNELIQYAEGLR